MALTTEDKAEGEETGWGRAGAARDDAPGLQAGCIVTAPTSRPSRHQLGLSDWRTLLVAGDLLALAAALSSSPLIPQPSAASFATRAAWYGALVAVWLVVAAVADAYDLRTAARWRASVICAGRAGLATATLYLLALVVSAPLPDSWPAALAYSLSCLLLLIGWRAAYAWLLSRPRLRTRVLVVGAGRECKAVVEAIRELGCAHEVVGVVDPDPARWGTAIAGVPVVGSIADLSYLLDERRVDEIVLAEAEALQDECQVALLHAAELGIHIARAPDLYESITRRVLVTRSGQGWLDILRWGAGSGMTHSLYRRALDLAFAIPGVVALAIVLPFATLAIRLDSPGPIFYFQERVGLRGKRFRIAKLRSMRQDAEASGQAIWASPADSRVTRVGRILRKTRIDELPQFLSILRGDMSVVGPRPERPVFVSLLERRIPCYQARHLVKPGLTGWAQVNYRYGSNVEDARVKLEYDLYYIKHWSPLLDLLTILKTIGIVIRCKGT